MTATEAASALVVPPRVIAIPASVSPEAQAYLASPPIVPPMAYPPLQDLAGWRELVASVDELVLSALNAINVSGIEVGHIGIADAGVFTIAPPNAWPDDDRICLDIHGGGLITGSGECCRATGIFTATRFGLRTWAVDYRMPPDHPYPAGAATIASPPIARCSKSGNRATSSSRGYRQAPTWRPRSSFAREMKGAPLPAAAVLLTPELDLAESGDSFRTNLGVDTVLTRSLMPQNLLYANGADLADPYLSPLYGDFSAGYPPTLLASGTRDLFLSNAVRMHRALRAAGVPADLHVLEAAPHGLLPGTPEDDELLRDIRGFIDAHCPPD